MHARLINALGGNSAVAKALGLPFNVVWNWSARDCIAWPKRHAVAQLAADKRIELPPDFFGEDRGAAE